MQDKPRKVGLLVVGAGPKGVAIAAKHHALSLHHKISTEYLLVERHDTAAHWTGKHGYTDGLQTLVSPPEQDLGYPYKSYRSIAKGEYIDRAMQGLSWESFLVEKKHSRDTWILEGRKSPTHTQFVEYLQWAASQIKINQETGQVTQIDLTNKLWKVTWNVGDKNVTHCLSDGLVITGNGGPKRIGGKGEGNPRICDGRNFWEAQCQKTFAEIKAGDLIGVVGAGETAGTIALAILDIIERNADRIPKDEPMPEIMLICKQAGYFLRSDVAKDLRYFSDPLGWKLLNVAQRLGTIKRADRGVVSAHVKHRLEHSDLVSYHVAELGWKDADNISESGQFLTEMKYGLTPESKESVEQPFDFLVSALGFDDLWFLTLFTDKARLKLIAHVMKTEKQVKIETLRDELKKKRQHIEDIENPEVLAANLNEPIVSMWLQRKFEFAIDKDLSIKGFSPKLHLPRLAGLMQGPGFPNLNCLGLLSDRIWLSYEKTIGSNFKPEGDLT